MLNENGIPADRKEHGLEALADGEDGVQITLPFNPEAAAVLRKITVRVARSLGVEDGELDDVRAAVSELFGVLSRATTAGSTTVSLRREQGVFVMQAVAGGHDRSSAWLIDALSLRLLSGLAEIWEWSTSRGEIRLRIVKRSTDRP